MMIEPLLYEVSARVHWKSDIRPHIVLAALSTMSWCFTYPTIKTPL